MSTSCSLKAEMKFVMVATFALVWGTAIAGEMKIELPPETSSFKPGPGAEMANGQCLVCHSVEYVQIQPASPRAFWAASVKKMREKFGAQIPADQIEPLTDYLARNYGTETSAASTTVATTTTGPTATRTLSGETVAGKYGCLACHNVEVKIVGPPYKAIAAKYQNDASAPAKIAEQIHKGGSGKWGPVIMPPFPMVSEAETKALTEWILSKR